MHNSVDVNAVQKGGPVASSAAEVGANAPSQTEVEAQMEAKRRRDFEWEPARLALLKVFTTMNMLADLHSLFTCYTRQFVVPIHACYLTCWYGSCVHCASILACGCCLQTTLFSIVLWGVFVYDLHLGSVIGSSAFAYPIPAVTGHATSISKTHVVNIVRLLYCKMYAHVSAFPNNHSIHYPQVYLRKQEQVSRDYVKITGLHGHGCKVSRCLGNSNPDTSIQVAIEQWAPDVAVGNDTSTIISAIPTFRTRFVGHGYKQLAILMRSSNGKYQRNTLGMAKKPEPDGETQNPNLLGRGGACLSGFGALTGILISVPRPRPASKHIHIYIYLKYCASIYVLNIIL